MGKEKSGTRAGRKKRIPKSIGGMKLPKELRRSGEALLDTIDTPQTRAMIAAGVTAAAAAVTQAAMAQATRAGATQAPRATESAEGAAMPAAGPDGGGATRDGLGQAIGMMATAAMAGWMARKATRASDAEEPPKPV